MEGRVVEYGAVWITGGERNFSTSTADLPSQTKSQGKEKHTRLCKTCQVLWIRGVYMALLPSVPSM